MDDNLGPRLTAKFTDLAPLSTDQLIPFNLHFQPENIMPRENNRSFTPLEDAQNNASLFARNLQAKGFIGFRGFKKRKRKVN